MTFTFTEEEMDSLTSYRELFQELRQHTFLFDPHFQLAPSFTWEEGGFVEAAMTGYNRDSFYSCLILMRHFISNDPHSFLRSCTILSRHAHPVNRADILMALGNSRETWMKNWRSMGTVEIVSQRNGIKTAYTNEVFFNLVINGRVAHADAEKAKELRHMPDFQKNILLSNLQACLANNYLCLMNVDLVADVMLNKPEKRLNLKSDPQPPNDSRAQ